MMSKKKSYMDKKNVLKESFIDDLLNTLFPRMQKMMHKRYMNKPKVKKKLAKYDKQLKDIAKRKKVVTKDFEKAFEKETGKQIKLGDLSIEDILKGKHIKG